MTSHLIRRVPSASVLLLSVAAAFVLVAPVSTQSPGRVRTRAIHQGREVAAGEVLVKFRDGNSINARATAEQRVDADESRPVGGTGLRRLHSRRLSVAAMLDQLRADPNVEYAEPNYVLTAHGTEITPPQSILLSPNDTSFGNLWGLQNTGQFLGQTGISGVDISATSAWNLSTGSRANVVGVIDTGIDYNHPDLAANIWSAPSAFNVTIGGSTITCAAGTHGFNAITNTCDPLDDNNHGTHVSGTIGGVGNNSVGVAGVNWTASIIGGKFLGSGGSGFTSDAVDAIEFMVQAKAFFGSAANIRVLNNSWGGSGFSQALQDEITRANTNEMLFVASAGNDASNNDAVNTYPANYPVANVLSVAATDNRDGLASFSNYGATKVHIGAPGVTILSTTRSNTYSYFNGTSMASPHVTGAAALALSLCSMNTATLKSAILSNVDAVAALSGKTTTGGRLNALKLLQACAATTIAVTVQTNPTGLAIIVDGGLYTSPHTFNWTPGSSHTIASTATHSGASGVRYAFINWSDGQALSHTVAPSAATTYTANYSTLYLLTMRAGTGGTASPSSDYYNSGQSVTISATANPAFAFSAWDGVGPGSYTGSINGATVTMNGPITQTASFVSATTAPGAPTAVVAAAGNANASVSFGPPSTNGGSSITSYTVTAAPGGITATAASSPIVVNGLSNGTSYTFTVRATNAIGTGPASAPSRAAIPHAPNVGQDFDLDGKNDLLWRNQSTGQNIAWHMNAATMLSFTPINTVTDTAYQIKGIADFNSDGKADLLWRNRVTGSYYIWLMDGTTFMSSTWIGSRTDLRWDIVGTPDLNADGKPDILWNNIATGENQAIYMDGLTGVGSSVDIERLPNNDWRVVGTADFNGDAKADIVVRNIATGDNAVWYMNGVTHTSTAALPPVADTRWELVNVADFTGDNQPDLVWRNPTSGQVILWVMDGTSRVSFVTMTTVPSPWAIVPSANAEAVAPPICTSFAIAPDSVDVSAVPGSQTVAITGAPVGCAGGNWTAVGNGTWLTVSPLSGHGPAAVTVSWAANSQFSIRSSSILIAGRSFGVTQAVGSPTVPDAPTAVVASGGDGKALVWFNYSANDGGSPISSYTVTVSPGGATVTQTSVPILVTGLTNNTPYTFTVRATNGIGTGPASAPSAPATPHSPNVGQDFDGDGKNDIVWRNQSSGQNIEWQMDGAARLAFTSLPTVTDTNFEIKALADFSNDGKVDILWRHATTGNVYIWTMDGTALVSSTLIRTVADLNWDIAATGDFDGDGFIDMVWSNSVTAQNIVWFMNGLTYTRFEFLGRLPSPGYRIAGAADFNSDGKPDIVIRNAATGESAVWLMNGTTLMGTAALPSVADETWQIVTVADFTGDGKADLVWRNTTSGLTILWVMNGATRTSFSVIGTVPVPWFVAPGQR